MDKTDLSLMAQKVLNKKDINKIVAHLKSGAVLVFPTETSYGMGCDPTNQQAVDKIFIIKNRSKNKPLLVVVDSVKTAKKYLEWNETLNKLAKKYWPGPLTAVASILSLRSYDLNLADGVVGLDQTVAIRVTEDPFLQELTRQFGKPVVATSANLAGEENIYSFEKIKEIFGSKDDIILVDGGDLEKRSSSTLVSVINGKIEVLREGELKI